MFVVKRKNIIITLTLLLSVITAVYCFVALSNVAENSVATAELKVVIDAGHGGIDGGVVGVRSGVKESELNLAVAKKLKKLFLSAGVEVVMTRDTENGLYGTATKNLKKKDMRKRRDIINAAKPTMVISIHMNKYSSSTRRGAQVFFDINNDSGKLLADSVQKSLNEMDECVRQYAALKGDYYILNSHSYPACIVECGFLSNPEDESLLLDSEYQDKLAYAVFKGSIDYLTETSFYGKFF